MEPELNTDGVNISVICKNGIEKLNRRKPISFQIFFFFLQKIKTRKNQKKKKINIPQQ